MYTDDQQDLLAAFHRGERAALHTVYQLFIPELVVFAKALTTHTQAAEDIATDCFITAYHKTGDFSTLGKLKTFLFTSARNAAINFVKEQQRHQAIHNDLGRSNPYFAEDPERTYLRIEAAQLIVAEIEKLPSQCAAIVRRSVVDGKLAEEIAQELNLAYKTVVNQRAIGLKLLRMSLLKNKLLSLPLLAMIQTILHV